MQLLANGLKSLGVKPGDVVGIYLPMIPEVVVAMQACARIGAVHNVVFGGFSVSAVTERMEVSDAKVLITVDGARRKGKTAPVKPAVDAQVEPCHVVAARRCRAMTGTECAMQGRPRRLVPRAVRESPIRSAHPNRCRPSTRSTSCTPPGSTAKPKGILHTTGGYLTGVAFSHRLVFDLDPEPTSTGARPTSGG